MHQLLPITRRRRRPLLLEEPAKVAQASSPASEALETGRGGFHSVPHPEAEIGDAVERVPTGAAPMGEKDAVPGANDEARPGDVTAALRSFGKAKGRSERE